MMNLVKHSKRLLLIGAVAATIAGCSTAPSDQKTQREAATKQWNQARAGVMLSLATDQYKTGNFDKARSTVDEAMSVDPENVRLYVLSAQIAIEQNRLELADKQLAEAVRRDGKNAEAYYLSGVVAQRWQKLELALDHYTKASDLQPSELAYLMARAEMLVMLNRRPEAYSALSEKVIYFEHSAALRDAVGQLLMQEKKYAEAVDLFRQASVLASEDMNIRERLGVAQFHAGDYRAAIETLTQVVQSDGFKDRGDLLCVLGEAHLQAGQNVESRQSFQTGTDLNPGSSVAWMGLGKAALALNDLRRADGAIRRAISLSPENADAHLLLGYLRLKQDRADDSIRAFQSAHRLNPSDSAPLCMIGHVLAKQGHHDEAVVWYGRALKVNPKDDLAMRLISMAQIGE